MLRSALLVGDSGLVEGSGSAHEEGTCRVQRIAAYPRVEVSADGTGVVSHVGSRLLADVAAAAGLPEVFDEAAGRGRKRCSAHAPGRVLSDLAVLLADGGQTITDLAVLRHQPGLFGRVASTATAWRGLDSVDDSVLSALKRARAQPRERAWMLRGEAGRPVPMVSCGGVDVAGLVIDFDASLVTCHSEKGQAASTFKHGYGYHPLLVWLDNTSEALAGMLRPGNAGSNTAADHIQLTDEAFAQIPDAELSGQPVLVRLRRGRRHKGMACPSPQFPRPAWSGCAFLGRVHRLRSGQRRHSAGARRGVGHRGRRGRDASPGRRDRAAGRPARRADPAAARPHRGGLARGDAGPGPSGTTPPRRADQRVRSPR